MADENLQEQTEETVVDTQTSEVQEQSTEDSEIVFSNELFQEMNRKMDTENYEPTSSELEAYNSWEADGRPEPQKAEEKPAEETAQPEEKPAEEASEVIEKGETETEKPAETKTSDYVSEAMARVGAKSEEELVGKIGDLVKTMRESGGELGRKLKESNEKVQLFESFMDGLKSGDATAMAYLQQQVPDLIKGNMSNPNTPPQDAMPEDIVDEGLYRHTNTQFQELQKNMAKMEQMMQQGFQPMQQQQTEQHQQQEAQAAQLRNTQEYAMTVRESLINNRDLIPEGANIQEFVNEYYFGNHGEKMDVKFDKLHNFLDFAVSNNLGQDLNRARVIYDHEQGSFANQLAEAEKRGRESVLNVETTVGLGPNRMQGGGDQPMNTINESDVQSMIEGRAPIPSEWRDANGQFVKENIPEVAHKYVFGGGGHAQTY